MSSNKHAVREGESPQSVGRITPVNLQGETQKWNSSTFVPDIARGGDCDSMDCQQCHLWA